MNKPSFSFAKLLLCTSAIAVCAIPGLAHANYVYHYTGNPFQVTYTEHVNLGDGNFITVETPIDTFLNAEIQTTELLSPGSTIDDVTSIRFYANFIYGSTKDITYPGPPPGDYNPEVGGGLGIGSIDENGLPTSWSIGTSVYAFYGGRGHFTEMSTTNFKDTLNGYDEPFIAYAGELNNQPGVWQLAVSPVPEPETYALLMVGLGIVAGVARKKSKQ